MKARLMIAVAAAAALAAAGSASALVGTPSLTVASKVASSAGGNGATAGNHDTTKTQRVDCNDHEYIEYQGPDEIWPPNHKMRDFSITAVDTHGGSVTLMTTVSSNQPLNGPGDGNTPVDFTAPMTDSGQGSATNNGQVRAERAGTDKAGRTYTFDSTAKFDDGQCQAQFHAHVPHDQRDQTNTGNH